MYINSGILERVRHYYILYSTVIAVDKPRYYGSTVWNGSVFNCTSQKITLFHESTEGIHGKCGDIVGQSLRSDIDVNATNGNSTTVSYYTSRLTVPIYSGTVGTTIECHNDDGQTSTLVGREKVNITIGIL